MKKAISICSPQLGISPKSHLGGEVYDFEIIDGLVNNGIKCQILLPKNKLFKKHKNLIVEYLPISFVYPAYIFNLFALPYLIKKYLKKEFNILRIHTPFYLGYAAFIFKKLFPKSKICLQFLLREDSSVFMNILNQTIHVYDHFLVPSQYLKSYLMETFNIKQESITIIYGGLSDKLTPKKKDRHLVDKYNLQNKVVLLNVGSFTERKNVLFLLDLFKKLKEKNENIYLIYCGAGELKSELNLRVNKYGLEDSVLILDPIYGQEKNKIYNLCDIFMFPTKNDGLGLVAVEAMTCLKPIVGSNNTALPEVITDGLTGYLAKTNDIKDWFKKTQILIDNESLRIKMGREGAKKAKKDYNWDRVAKLHIQAFDKMLSQ